MQIIKIQTNTPNTKNVAEMKDDDSEFFKRPRLAEKMQVNIK